MKMNREYKKAWVDVALSTLWLLLFAFTLSAWIFILSALIEEGSRQPPEVKTISQMIPPCSVYPQLEQCNEID